MAKRLFVRSPTVIAALLWPNLLALGCGHEEDVRANGAVASLTDDCFSYTLLPEQPGDLHSGVGPINNRGQAGGARVNAAEQTVAAIWDHGVLLEIEYPPDIVNSSVIAINDNGVAVILAHDADRNPHTLVWDDGVLTDIGSLGGGATHAGSSAPGPSVLNARNQIVGGSTTADGESHAFLWSKGVMRDLGTLPGDPLAAGGFINDKGQVAGDSGTGSADGARAFFWKNGRMEDLGFMGLYAFATGMNDRGVVVGVGALPSFERHGFAWRKGVLEDLGVDIEPTDINNRGQIVGTMLDPASQRRLPVLLQDGQVHVIETPSGRPFIESGPFIDERGDIVGSSSLLGDEGKAFFWHAGTVVDLGTISDRQTFAGEANEIGQIAGSSYDSAGYHHAVIWDIGDCDFATP